MAETRLEAGARAWRPKLRRDAGLSEVNIWADSAGREGEAATRGVGAPYITERGEEKTEAGTRVSGCGEVLAAGPGRFSEHQNQQSRMSCAFSDGWKHSTIGHRLQKIC